MFNHQLPLRNGVRPVIIFFSFLLCLVLLVTPQVRGVATEDDGITQGKELFFQGRQTYYSAEAPLAQVVEVLTAAKKVLGQAKNYEGYYWLGQTEYLLGEVAETMGNQPEAARAFTESGKWAKQALEVNKNSSDALRLLADTYMRLMNYRGSLYMVSHGPQALKLLKKALALEKNNYTALNSLAMYYINAPAIGGGDIDQGIKALEKALHSTEEFDNFISYVWLGTAWQKKGDPEKAKAYFRQALTIYPANSWAKGLLEGCE
ncbi:MAG TPA: tetratricopeptide repeat protein [Firmicutes bacterium]|mgnify:CR=1 FL=1|nr:tetratricopeptide repeat protein [Bacillota bacterium]